MMLIVSAISFDRSKNYILEELFEKRISYDCQIIRRKLRTKYGCRK